MTITYEDKGRGVLGALVNKGAATYAVRITPEASRRANGPTQVFRIDQAGAVGGCWLPWEPITGEEFTTSRAAMKAIRAWAES